MWEILISIYISWENVFKKLNVDIIIKMIIIMVLKCTHATLGAINEDRNLKYGVFTNYLKKSYHQKIVKLKKINKQNHVHTEKKISYL